jgi:hypothetical protein
MTDFADFCTQFDGTDIGVSGWRYGPATPQQAQALVFMIENLHEHGATCLHHGRAIGVDAFAHDRAYRLASSGMVAYVHPPSNDKFMVRKLTMWPGCFEFAPKPYGVRDRDIATSSAVLLAGPQYPRSHPDSRRSGTWLTVSLALDLGVPVFVADTLGRIHDYSSQEAAT